MSDQSKHFNLRFIMEGDRPLLQVDLYLPWESLLKVAQAIRWAARVQPTQESRHDS
jgi:hypothetical protein